MTLELEVINLFLSLVSQVIIMYELVTSGNHYHKFSIHFYTFILFFFNLDSKIYADNIQCLPSLQLGVLCDDLMALASCPLLDYCVFSLVHS